MKQYTESYSTCPTDIQNIVANDVALMEEYVLMQTGQYEWTAQINTIGINKARQIKFTRSNNYNTNYYTVERKDNVAFDNTVTNEYYVYSNIGYGKSLDLPVYEGVTAWSTIILATAVMLAIVFKGVLFKCLDKRRSR